MNLYWGLQSHKNNFFLNIPKSKTFADSFWRILESKNVAKCGKNSYGLRETPKWVGYDHGPVVLTWEQFCPQWTFLSCSEKNRCQVVIKACMDSNKSNTYDWHIFNKVRIYCASTLQFFLLWKCISSSDADKYHFCFVFSINLRNFAPEASRADTRKSGLANRAIALSHGGQGTMRKY